MDEIQNTPQQQTSPMYRDRALWVSVLLLLASITFFWVAPFTGFYWYKRIGSAFIAGWESGQSAIALMFVGGSWLLIIRYLVIRAKGFNARAVIVILTTLNIFFNIIGAAMGLFLIAGIRPLDSATLNNNHYHLESWGGFDGTNYYLIKCNRFEFACNQITSIPNEVFTSLLDIQLIADPDTNTLLIVDDSNTIYTYTPE